MNNNELNKEEMPAPVRRDWRRIALRLVIAVAILGGLWWIARDAGEEIRWFETWVDGNRVPGLLLFVAVAILLTSLFVPTSVLSAVAGAAFGLGWGTVAMCAACFAGAALNYMVANRFLRGRIAGLLQRYPKLLSIQRAVQHEGWQLQFLVRLTPLNPASVNYVLGSAGVRFSPYLVGALGLAPGLFVEVLFGHAAKHVAASAAGVGGHSTGHVVLTIAGFVACVGVMALVGRRAKRAIEAAEAREA